MKRLFSTSIYASVWALVLFCFAWVAIESLSSAIPPERPAAWTGNGYQLKRDGQRILHLAGDPYALGYHNSNLLAPLLKRQEDELLDLLFHFTKSPFRAALVRQASLLYLFGLSDYLTEAERVEILGLVEGSPDPFPELGNRYARITAYHAIHELSQRYAFDHPLMACSAIAISSKRGKNGHAYLARNFDFEAGPVFDRDKVILAVRPKEGFGFVSVSWAGMAGVVSGMNEHGLAITINAGASEDYRRIGTPTGFLVRRALEQARNINEAIKVLTSSPTFVTDIISLADAGGNVAVLELTPSQFGIREGDIVASTNHLESTALVNDRVSLKRQVQTTTLPRRQRLESIVQRLPQKIGPEVLLEVLRDRKNTLGVPLPPGHRHSIDALIATHSIIFDATARKIWVSQGPHTLGDYKGYDIRKMIYADSPEEMKKSYIPALPADPLLSFGPILDRTRQLWAEINRMLDEDKLDTAEALLEKTRLMAHHPTTLQLRGKLAEATGELTWAQRFYRQALASPPEYSEEIIQIKAAISRLESRLKNEAHASR